MKYLNLFRIRKGGPHAGSKMLSRRYSLNKYICTHGKTWHLPFLNVDSGKSILFLSQEVHIYIFANNSSIYKIIKEISPPDMKNKDKLLITNLFIYYETLTPCSLPCLHVAYTFEFTQLPTHQSETCHIA